MPNRARNYMDRLLGKNEGSEGRDFTDGRRYGEEQRFYEDPFNDSGSEWNDQRRGNYDRDHRTQASRTKPRQDVRSNYDRDYNVRRNPPEESQYYRGGIDNNVRENRGMNHRNDSNDSFYQNDFRNTNQNRGYENRGFFGKGPKGWKRSDEKIREEVSEALYRDYQVDASDIEIDVKEGIVTLSGTVDSRQSKRSAEECIENLSGVVDVHNRIRIAEKGNVSNLRTGKDNDEKRSLS